MRAPKDCALPFAYKETELRITRGHYFGAFRRLRHLPPTRRIEASTFGSSVMIDGDYVSLKRVLSHENAAG